MRTIETEFACMLKIPEKCLSQSEARTANLVFRSALNTNLVDDVEILLPVNFRPFVSEEKSNCLSQSDHLGFPISPNNANLVEDVEILLPAKFR